MMNTVVIALAFAAGTNALAIRGNGCQCTTKLRTGGDVSFPVGEDSEGEILGGSKLENAELCFDGDHFVDKTGNPCWFTPPTDVLQCDANASASTGFTIDCNGQLSYQGSTEFYECPNGIDDEVNIYSKPDQGTKCGKITLFADSCHAECPKPTTTTAPPPATTTAAQSTCPMDLPGGYEFPHLIVPIDSSNKDKAAGTSYFGEVSSTISTIFNFDIPQSDSGKQCTLWFLLPKQSQLQTSSYSLSGSGAIGFQSLSGIAKQDTTYSNAPSVAADLGEFTVVPGNAYKISTFDCPAGRTVAYEATSKNDTSLKFFQDYNPCPIGVYVVPS